MDIVKGVKDLVSKIMPGTQSDTVDYTKTLANQNQVLNDMKNTLMNLNRGDSAMTANDAANQKNIQEILRHGSGL